MDPIAALTEINLDDLISSFGIQESKGLSALVRRIFRFPAQKFARQMVQYDRWVGEKSLPEAGLRTLRGFARSLHVFGRENIPTGKPALFLSNHPGMVDTLALFAAIGRADLSIIALNRPFLRSLPNTTKRLFFVGDEPSERINAVRQAAYHLRREKGSVLTFPAGHIEPDPAVYPGAVDSLAAWTDSTAVFLRLAPETRIVPVFVRGVLWNKAVRFPLTRMKKDREDRERMGAAFQLLAHIMFDARPLEVKVQFGEPLGVEEIGSSEAAAVQASLLTKMRALAETEPGPGGWQLL